MNRTLLAVAVLLCLVFAQDVQATLTCTESESGAFRCEESIDNAGQYIWTTDVYDQGALQWVTDGNGNAINVAYFVCSLRYSPPADVGGVLVQEHAAVKIRVGMPLIGAFGITHEVTVDCYSQSPDPAMFAYYPPSIFWLTQPWYYDYYGGGYSWDTPDWSCFGFYGTYCYWMGYW